MCLHMPTILLSLPGQQGLLNFDQAAGSSGSVVQLLMVSMESAWGKIFATHQSASTVTQDFTMANLAILTWRYLYLQNFSIIQVFQTIANLSYDQKCCPFNACDLQLLSFVKDQGKYTIHKLHWLAVHFW